MAVAILKQFIPLYSLTRMGHFSISLLLVHMTSSKFKTKYELSIPLSFYFHKVLELTAHFWNGVSVLGRILERDTKNWPICRTGYQFQGKFFLERGANLESWAAHTHPKNTQGPPPPSTLPLSRSSYFESINLAAIISSNHSIVIHISVPQIFSMTACNLCNLDFLKSLKTDFEVSRTTSGLTWEANCKFMTFY